MDLQSKPIIKAGPSSWRDISRRGETVGQILDRHRGIGPGFDSLRFSLSIMIFVVHVGAIMSGTEAINEDTRRQSAALASGISGLSWNDIFFAYWGALRPLRFTLSGAFVPMFFALSGFLVTGSAFRLSNLRSFLLFRVIRIVPALSGEVLLSAFILGPLLTIIPLSEYFRDPQFYRYFGNIAGFITYELPGLFVNNPLPKVINGNLWTLPGEFYCYFLLERDRFRLNRKGIPARVEI